MIIKSMTRKENSFTQLIDYLNREGVVREEYHIHQHLYGRKMDEVIREFEANARLLPKRKNGVTLYHEVLSITKSNELDLETQKQLLREIATRYLNERAPDNIALGVMHDDTQHNLHYHFVISANGYKEAKRTRLSKAQFAAIQKGMENHVLENYPQLKQEVAINKKASRKLSKQGAELQRRTGRMPKREQMISRLNNLFEAQTKTEAASLLAREQVEFYQRGKNIGVIDLQTGKRHRLTTLGLMDGYKAFVERVELSELKAHVAKAQAREARTRQPERQQELETQSVSNAERSPEPEQIRERPEQAVEPEREQPVLEREVEPVIEQTRQREPIETIRDERRERLKSFRMGKFIKDALTRKR